MKFETKLKFTGNEFAGFYQVIVAAEAHYKKLANSGTDLSLLAEDILYWRILFNLKVRLETMATKYQGRLIGQVSVKLSDFETTCFLNAVLPPGNNTFLGAIVSRVRNEAYKSTHRHVFNIHPSPALLTPQNVATNHRLKKAINTKYNFIDFEE